MPATPRLVDSHCHLNMVADRGVAIEDAIARAHAAGVWLMQTICTRSDEVQKVIAIAEGHEEVYASVGVHPHETENDQVTTEQLVTWAKHPKVIGIGESGLDYYYEHSNREAQQQSFRAHIEASRITQLPLIVHSRDADEDTVAILQEEQEKGAFPFLIHCFSTGAFLAESAITMGGYISLSGILTFKKSEALQAIARDLPLERLLVETDAPYLAPAPHRGQVNEPAFTLHTAEKLAELHQCDLNEIAEVTTANFFALFTKAASSHATF